MTTKALGKGLSALLPPKEVVANTEGTKIGSGETLLNLQISQIRTNKYQPRVEFDREKLADLMNSIKEKGVVQPILVRKTSDGYELIAGERRLRAVKNLGIESIPAIVKNAADIDMLELSLIENIQREELNPMEEARAFEKFISDFNFTQDKIATVLGKDRSTIANTMRLLALPQKVQDYISKNSISAGHAKAILSIQADEDRIRVANLVVKKGLSVRETEALVSRRKAGSTDKVEIKKDPHIRDMENFLQQKLGTRVKIAHGKKRGAIMIEYYSNEDLNRIISILAPDNI